MSAAPRRAWGLLAGAIVSEVAATLSLRGAIDHPPLYAVVVVGYLVAFALMAAILRLGMPLGVAYGVWGACGVAATAVLGAVLFGEALTAVTGVGIVLIVAGVLVIDLGGHDGAEETS